MKKLLSLICLLALVLPTPSSACEYESQSYYNGIVYYGYRPVITGVNAADNLVVSWNFDTESYMYEIGSFSYTDPVYSISTTFYYMQYRNAISLVRQDPGHVHFPLTVYVSLLGYGNANNVASMQLPKGPLTPVGVSRSVNYVENIQSVELQYRIYPDTTWISAGVRVGFSSFPNYDAIVSASLPAVNNFSIISNKARACYGRYTIDPGIVPQGTLVQMRLVTTYDNPTYQFEESNRVQQVVSSRETKSSPSSYYAVVPTVIGSTGGDWVTVTASGKRRPRHDQ